MLGKNYRCKHCCVSFVLWHYSWLINHHPYLFQWQQHELLSLGHLHKVLQDILVCWLEQVAAGVCVSEASDAQAVWGVQLAEEELTAGVPHPIELQQARCWEQCLQQVETQSLLIFLCHMKKKEKSGLAVVYVNLKRSSLPAHFLPRPQSLLCRHTGPAAPKPEGQCREGSRGSDGSQTSHLRGRTEWDQINFNKLHRVKLQLIAKLLPLQSYWHMASHNIYSTAAKCQHSSFVTVY